jgi:hypothetical protein
MGGFLALENMSKKHIVQDFFMRVFEKKLKISYFPESIFVYDTKHKKENLSSEKEFLKKWNDKLIKLMNKKLQIKSELEIAWDSETGHCTGFFLEAAVN